MPEFRLTDNQRLKVEADQLQDLLTHRKFRGVSFDERQLRALLNEMGIDHDLPRLSQLIVEMQARGVLELVP